MKITILGAGDEKTIIKNSKLDAKKIDKLVQDAARLIAKLKAEIIIVPSRGIPHKFAKLYKKFKGKRVFGVIPVKCPFYGKYTQEIIGPYIDIIDEKIGFNSWYDVDGNIATLGDFTICFGLSAGVMAEISEMKYNLKYLKKKTKLIIFKNTISKELPKEIEKEIKPIYIDSVKKLRKIIK